MIITFTDEVVHPHPPTYTHINLFITDTIPYIEFFYVYNSFNTDPILCMNFSYVKLTFSVPFQRTIESKKFTGINDLQDVPTKLNSLSRASKTFVVEVQDEEDEVVVKTERYLNEAEEQEEQGPKTGRQNDQSSLIEMQQKEIEELKTRYSLNNPSNSAALQLVSPFGNFFAIQTSYNLTSLANVENTASLHLSNEK